MTQPTRPKRIKTIANTISDACRRAAPLLRVSLDVARIASLIARLYDHAPWL